MPSHGRVRTDDAGTDGDRRVTPPLVVDIDGTLTGPDRGIDPRTMPVLKEWAAPVVVATGKAFPYPVGLCEFLAIPIRVIAENGGVSYVAETETVVFTGEPVAAQAVAEEYQAAGYDLGWGNADMVNRWRETELAVSLDSPLEPLESIAADHGLEVVDTGFAYHVKSPAQNKGTGLHAVARELDLDAEDFVAVGDSENDVSTFEAAGRAIAVANADDRALSAADEVTDGEYGEGFLEAAERIGRDA
ncbi:phosphoglycolate phosphatase [Halorientalis salina]|uniref:phosphoglycolate phosphatase n=1 Tax=Halorientalis salina TaxID=2932266 RepID=UPI0010AC32E7|nr:phosphoglycolate phosphatase [Halorientalis salina]